jgi:tRNA threonylcarbamoyladenosine biosynthesis protein TsaE
MELESGSPEETEAIGAAVAAELEPGDVVTVSGELGAGKTTLVRGACRALGVEQPVTSPTYTVGNRYHGRIAVSHLDLYRFQGFSAAEWGDLEPYFDDAIAFVEWPEAAGDGLPAARVRVTLRHESPERRVASLASAEESLLERVRRRVDPRSRHSDDDRDRGPRS